MEIALTFCSLKKPAQCTHARPFKGWDTLLCSLGEDCEYGSDQDKKGKFLSIKIKE